MRLFVHMIAGVGSSQEKVVGPMEPELQEDVSCLVWVQGTKFRSSAKAVHTFSHRAIFPGSDFPLYYIENLGF